MKLQMCVELALHSKKDDRTMLGQRRIQEPHKTAKMESFEHQLTAFSRQIIYCCKALHFRCLQESWLPVCWQQNFRYPCSQELLVFCKMQPLKWLHVSLKQAYQTKLLPYLGQKCVLERSTQGPVKHFLQKKYIYILQKYLMAFNRAKNSILDV